jgi:hypothetical protein
MKILIVIMMCVVLATHAFGQAAIGKEAFCYTYETFPGYSHAKQCGGGFNLGVYDWGERLWAVYDYGELHDDGGQTYKAIGYSFRSKIDRSFFSALASNLVAVGVHTLEQLPMETNCYVRTSLISRVGGKEVDEVFHTPPTAGVQKEIHSLARAFGTNLWHTYPQGATVTTQVWEKTTAPARKVELDYLLSHPKEFLRKRVIVEGFYHCEFECSNLSTEPEERGLWIGGPATDVTTNLIQWVSNGWIRVEGTYHAYFDERDDKPHGGHMGVSLGELMYVTEFTPLKKTGSIQSDGRRLTQ